MPALALFALTAWLFWPATANDFTAYDDDAYVTRNVWVREGLQPAGLHWALTTFHEANWHPLAWLSHMLDVTLFGLDPFGHHLASVLLHAANASLLFAFLLRATGAAGRSALVAALFAAHPLHVESAAWVAERKDVLCAFFWLLTLLAYVGQRRRPGAARSLGVTACFALALLSKAMAVTLPFALLLLDFWPLGRWLPPPAGGTAPSRRWLGLLREKIPLFLLAAAAGVVALAAQARGGALGSFETFPFPVRAANALVSYGTYLLHAFWPRDLAVIYPHPHALPPSWSWLGASVALFGVTVWAMRGIRARPWVATGWLWYLGTLLPVIGLVQIGIQARSDRYTYLPLVGIFVALVWTAAAALGRRGLSTAATAGCIVMMLAALAAAARIQIGYWRDDATLFEHAIAAVKDNRLAHLTRGVHLANEGRREEAQRHYAAARLEGSARGPASGAAAHGAGTAPGPRVHDTPGLAALPPEARENYRLGNELTRGGRFDQAVRHYDTVLRLVPEFAPARNNLGVARAALGDRAGARAAFTEAGRRLPASAEPLVNLGNLLALSGDLAGARDSFRRALSLQPDSPVAHLNLGDVLLERGERYRALFEYREALRIDPDSKEARQRLESGRSGDRIPAPGRPAGTAGTVHYQLFP